MADEPRIVTCSCGYRMYVPEGWTKQFGKCAKCGAKVTVFDIAPIRLFPGLLLDGAIGRLKGS